MGLLQTLWHVADPVQQEKTLQQTLKAPQSQILLTLWPKTWLHQAQLEEPKASAAQNPLTGGLMMRWLKNGG